MEKITKEFLIELGFENSMNKDFWFQINIKSVPKNWTFTLVTDRFLFNDGDSFYYYPNMRYTDFDFKTNKRIYLIEGIDYNYKIEIKTVEELKELFFKETSIQL